MTPRLDQHGDAKALPCPFCGAAPHVYWSKLHCYIECVREACPAMPATPGHDSEGEAIAAWNRRDVDAASAQHSLQFVASMRQLLGQARVAAWRHIETTTLAEYAADYGRLSGIVASMQDALDAFDRALAAPATRAGAA